MWRSAVFVCALATLQLAFAPHADYRLTKTYGRNPQISLDIETGGALWFWPDKKVHSLRIIAEIYGIRRPLPPKFNITETQTWHRISYKAKSHALHIRPGGIRHEAVFEEEYFDGLTFRHDSGTVYWMLLDSKENPGFTIRRPPVKCPKFEVTSERTSNMVEPSVVLEETMPLNRNDTLELLHIEKKSAKLTNKEPSLNTLVEQFPHSVEDAVNSTLVPDIDLFHTTTTMNPVINSPEHYLIPNDTVQQNTVLNQPFLGRGIDPDYPTLLGTDDDIPVSVWYQSIHGDGHHSGISARYQSLAGTDDDPALLTQHLDAERGDIPLSMEAKVDYVNPTLPERYSTVVAATALASTSAATSASTTAATTAEVADGESDQQKTAYKNKNEMFPKGDGPGVSSKHQSPWGW